MDKALKLCLVLFIALPLSGQTMQQGIIMSTVSSTSAWAHVHSITVDHTKVALSTDVTNFPMYFGGTFTWLKASGSGGDIQHSTTCCANTETVPADLIFTSDSGCTTMLNWDIPTWVSTTGVIEVWVNVPTISHTADTTIYACTGNAAITTYQATYTSTWDSNYKAVWHFGDGTTLDLHDSTINANTCTGVNTPTAGTGLLLTGGSIALHAASSQTADCGTPASLNITGAIAIEALGSVVSLPGSGSFPVMFANGGASGNNGYELLQHDNTGLDARALFTQFFNASSDTFLPSSGGGALTTNTTFYSAVHWAGGTSGLMELIINNIVCTHCQANPTSALGSSANHFFMGNRGTVANFYWDGTMDEIRISNVDRQHPWYGTQYNNMSSPGTFFTVVSIR